MPFTPTHILAVVPIAAIKRQPLPFSALVIGSMVPDMPMFLPSGFGPWTYHTSHTIAGLFTVCLPLGLMCFVVFHALMKRPLFALLPDVVRQRCASLAAAKLLPTRRTAVVASLAVVVGAATHVLWDSFTHAERWGTQVLPWLNESALTIGSYRAPRYKLFQYGSTFIGLPVLGFLLVRTLQRRPIEPLDGLPRLSHAGRTRAYACVALLPLAVALVAASDHGRSMYQRLGWTITRSGGALLAAALVYCVVFHLIRRRRAHGFSQ